MESNTWQPEEIDRGENGAHDEIDVEGLTQLELVNVRQTSEVISLPISMLHRR